MSNSSFDKKADVIAGRNVYINEKGQHILYDKATSRGYIIPESQSGSFVLYHNRIALAIAVGMLLAAFMNTWQMPLVIAVIFYALLELRYRRNWLPSLAHKEHYRPEHPYSLQEALIKGKNQPRCILLMFLYLAFGILLVVNEYQMEAGTALIIGSWAVLAVCVYMAANYLIAVLKMNSVKSHRVFIQSRATGFFIPVRKEKKHCTAYSAAQCF